MSTDGFIASINCSLGHTLVRVNFHSRGVLWGMLPAARASHLMVSFNTTLPKAHKLAESSTVVRLIYEVEF